MDAKMTCPVVPTTVIKTVLNTYRETGIQDSDINKMRSVKLFKVGFLTNSLGGNTKISDKGLNALLMIKTIGYAVNIPNRSNVSNKTTSPPKERFNALPG